MQRHPADKKLGSLESSANGFQVSNDFWAKTINDEKQGQIPGISVYDHCLNVGVVAERLISSLPPQAHALLPKGSATLSALHDIGKITLGFQSKCPSWLAAQTIDERTRLEIAQSISDHAYVSQYFLQELLRPSKCHSWPPAVGAHHGKPKGRSLRKPDFEACAEWAQTHRLAVAQKLISVFGPLPDKPINKALAENNTDLWLLAGLITVADWIGSNETFFSPHHGDSIDNTRLTAKRALETIGLPGGRLKEKSFADTFGFPPNVVQQVVTELASEPCLVIIEAPMGYGKTEAALAVAMRLIARGQNNGLYFGLPTQVTSNRIHQRVAKFLENCLTDTASLRLTHGHSWLEKDFDLRIHPTFLGSDDNQEAPNSTVIDARSWFASSKQALLATYGVGTIDQALQGIVAVKHFFVRRFALAGKVVILDEIHSYDVYTGTLVAALVRELFHLGCTIIILSATLTRERRRELLAAVHSSETAETSAFPLISVARRSAALVQSAPGIEVCKIIATRAEIFSEDTIVAELIARAESGQHVLWIRNTVAEAQASFRHIRGETPVSDSPSTQIKLGLLHSRYPFQRRQELEEFWLGHLGKLRPSSGPGSILVATQVVEQSVDIDLDFIVSDLAPTDMLLQRVGRLWRHSREQRAAPHPEFWVRLPDVSASPSTTIGALKKSLGRSARVYAPWVLLRSAAVFKNRTSLRLPDDIRTLLEATYAPPQDSEPNSWIDLHNELEAEKRNLTENANAAMLVLGRPTMSVDENSDQALTRRKGSPTRDVVLLACVDSLPNSCTKLTALDGSTMIVSEFKWAMDASRFIHRWIVRVPRWLIPSSAPSPKWLSLHAKAEVAFVTVGDHGRLICDGEMDTTCYHADFGVYTERISSYRTSPKSKYDDDEFDS